MRIWCHCLMGCLLLTGRLLAWDGPEIKPIHSQPSYSLSTPQVQLYVTEAGGHMAPVTFYRETKQPVEPYHVSPWQDEPASEMPVPVLVPLRGDFFCMPFGGNAKEVNGEKHPPHGEVAGSKWRFVDSKKQGPITSLVLSMETQVRKGKVTKELKLVDGHNAIYSQHTIEGFSGKVPLGHHATLRMPDKEGSVRIGLSPFQLGMTYPGLFSDPKSREYQSLLPGTEWKDLKKVLVAWQNSAPADLTALPARFGYADLIQVAYEQPKAGKTVAWTTATYTEEGFLWFAFKDPSVLRSTVFWIENHGRHAHPWNGRNHCLGLEDVTAYFADGLQDSMAENLWTKRGIPTAIELQANQATHIRYIQGVVKVPPGFGQVVTVQWSPGEATFVDSSGLKATSKIAHEFLQTGRLE